LDPAALVPLDGSSGRGASFAARQGLEYRRLLGLLGYEYRPEVRLKVGSFPLIYDLPGVEEEDRH
jgi:hypothetical protein